MQKKPKILVAISSVAVGGGAEKVAAALANNLHKSGYSTIVLTQYSHQDEHPLTVQRYTIGQSLERYRNMSSARRSFTKLTRAYARMIGTAKIFKKERPDIVISFLEESNFYVLFAKLIFRLPLKVIVSVRMDPMRYGSFYRFIIRHLYKRANTVVAVTRGVEKSLREEFGLKNVETIYNPIDIEKVQAKAVEPLPSNYAFLETVPYYVTTGRLTYQKGQWHLLRVFKRVIDSEPTARLVILGDGNYRQQLQKMAKTLGLEEAVCFAGQQNNVYAFLARSKAFVFTSLWEGLPNAVLEAMALGLPVVSVDSTSGMRELLAPGLSLEEEITYPYQGEGGVLVTPFADESELTMFRDIDGPYSEMANVIIDLESKPAKHITKFSPESITEEWIQLINSLNEQ